MGVGASIGVHPPTPALPHGVGREKVSFPACFVSGDGIENVLSTQSTRVCDDQLRKLRRSDIPRFHVAPLGLLRLFY